MAEHSETISGPGAGAAPAGDAAALAGAIAAKLGLAPARVQAAIGLIDEGNTIPFIARYRKEATGSMDDQKLREVSERWSTCAAWKNGAKRSASSSRRRTA